MSVTRQELQKIYHALADNLSKKIYKNRLLYSFFHDLHEIDTIVYNYSEEADILGRSKICFYGAGSGTNWMMRDNIRAPFVIDKYKKGTIGHTPIISLEKFLDLPDYRDYLVIVTVGREDIKEEIEQELRAYGIRYLFGYFDFNRFKAQYFTLPELNLHNEYFVDAGAYDGQNTKYLLDHFSGGYSYLMEPNPSQLEISKKNLNNYCNVEFFPYGLYNENKTLFFESDYKGSPSSARISETGTIEIHARKLDDVLKDRPVTFIKMDIEGSELAALQGAEHIIRTQKPKLAICVYHKPEDLWEIPSLILQYCSEYKLYLRHYSITGDETVLFAVP